MRVGPVGRPAASFRRQSVAVQGIVSRPVFWAVSTAWPSASTTCRNSSALMQIWAARARLTVASATSSQLSAGVRPPAAGVYQRVRSSSRRSLTVRTVWGSRPLFCRRRPSGAFGGGKSRFRGINLELQGGLVGVTAEVGEEVANLLLTGVDNVAGRGLVDGVGDTTAEFLEAAAQALQEGVGGNGWQGVHRGSGCYMKEKRLSELTVSIGNARKICRARAKYARESCCPFCPQTPQDRSYRPARRRHPRHAEGLAQEQARIPAAVPHPGESSPLGSRRGSGLPRQQRQRRGRGRPCPV